MKDNELLGKCIEFMVTAHTGQFDRGGMPYCLHPLKVMHYLKTDDVELKCIAVLHDTIEDSEFSFSDLYNLGCNDNIVNAVMCLTKYKGQTYDEYKQAVCSNVRAMRVKLCDLRHNSDIRRLKGLRQKDIDRLAKYNQFYTEILENLYCDD